MLHMTGTSITHNRREFLATCGAAALATRSSGARPGWWCTRWIGLQRSRRLRQQVNGQPLMYLDSAATTLRPQSVIEALVDYYSTDNANPSKVHRLAARSAERLALARQTVARFVHAADPSEIIFVRGTTEGHQSRRLHVGSGPPRQGGRDRAVDRRTFLESDALDTGGASGLARSSGWPMSTMKDGWRPIGSQPSCRSEHALVAFSHVSNVLGYVNPAREITAVAKAAGAAVVIDGAQGAPHVDIDVQDIGCDFYIFSGHKMLGPMASGVVWGRRGILDQMPPYHAGQQHGT